MASVATPVTVTTTSVNGVGYGTTVSAFCLVVDDAADGDGLARPLVGAPCRPTIVRSVRGQRAPLSASLGRSRLRPEGRRREVPRGAVDACGRHSPARGASGWLVCDIAKFIDGGDHVVLMGNVVEAENVVGSPRSPTTRGPSGRTLPCRQPTSPRRETGRMTRRSCASRTASGEKRLGLRRAASVPEGWPGRRAWRGGSRDRPARSGRTWRA